MSFDGAILDKLEIGIDGYNLAMPNGTGIKTYATNLAAVLKHGDFQVSGLFGIDAGQDPMLLEPLFFDRLARPEPEPTPQIRRRRAFRRNLLARIPWLDARPVEIPLTERVEKSPIGEGFPKFDRLMSSPGLFDYAHRYFRYHKRLMPVRVERPPAIMHWTCPIPLQMVGARNIYTIHDVVPLKLPYTTLDNKPLHRRLLKQCEAQGTLICTVSEHSRQDILTEFGWDTDRVMNTYQCSMMPEGFLDREAQDDAAVVEGIFGLQHQGYFVYFSAVEPKKNVARMLEAYLALGTTTPLVVVSGRSWQSETDLALLSTAVNDKAEIQRLAARVVRMDHLSRPLLLRLIRGAKAVLFPSLYEGFGLPVLESMQLGTPVLTSTAAALPEIAGEGALLIDPYDTGAIMAGIKALDEDGELRTRIGLAGLRQASRFSKEAYLTQLKALYQQALRAPEERDASRRISV